MDKKYIEENEIQIKYLRNELTPEEVEAFEVYLMENPTLLETLELDQSIIEYCESSTDSVDVGARYSIWHSALVYVRSGGYAVAVFAFLVGLSIPLFNGGQKDIFDGVVFRLEQTRDTSSKSIHFELSRTDYLIFEVDAHTILPTSHFLVMTDSNGKEMFNKEIDSDELGVVRFLMPRSNFEAGVYSLKLDSENDSSSYELLFKD